MLFRIFSYLAATIDALIFSASVTKSEASHLRHRLTSFFRSGLFISASLLLTACGEGSSSNPLATATPSGGPGILISPPTMAGNSVPIVIDAGLGGNQINVAYVSVTICTPGTSGATAACQTIDRVQVDTGSYGLRLLKSALYSNLNLPAVTNAGGQTIGECTAFAIGTTWGSVRLADIYLGGEAAKSVPFQEIGDQPGGVIAVPADCASTGAIQDTQLLLGSNGILGVGLFTNDCDACLSQIIPATYYTCSVTDCKNTTVTATQVVQNPVTHFSKDNNGVLIELPAVSAGGAASPVTGSLIFGIGTQSNNAMNGAAVYATDSYGNFRTTFNNATMPYSYIDSGSNALFFYDTSISICQFNTWAYCPSPSPMSLSATNTSALGNPSGVVSFSIVNLDQLSSSVVAANIGGTSVYGQFAWGLPFFYGRSVFTAISGKSTPAGPGPYWAY